MANPRKTFYILLSLIYFSPFLWILESVKSASSYFWSLFVWAFLGYAILAYFFRLFENGLFRSQLAPSKGSTQEPKEKMLGSISSQLKNNLKEAEEREEKLHQKIDTLKTNHKQQEREFTQLNGELQNQLDKKETILSEYRSTLQDQRGVIEKKQEDINLLQIRVNDLKYELENVLKLKDVAHEDPIPFMGPSSEVMERHPSSEKEPSMGLLNTLQQKLDRYVKMAMTLNSSHHLTRNPTQVPLGSLIIDQRRLFDRLQNEENETLMVYSREEKRLIFINNQITSLLGWSPERFLKDFSFLIQKNYLEWSDALEEVKALEQKNLRLLMKAKSGKEVLTHCYLKEVPGGVFKGHVLGLLSSPTH